MPRVAPRELERTTTGASAGPVHGVRDGDGAHSVPSVRRAWSARTASTWAPASPTSGAGGRQRGDVDVRSRRRARRAAAGRSRAACRTASAAASCAAPAPRTASARRPAPRPARGRARPRRRPPCARCRAAGPARLSASQDGGRADGREQRRSAWATRCARRRPHARAPAPSPRTAWRPGRAPGGRRPGRRSPRPGCACAASPRSRRGPSLTSPTSATSVCAIRTTSTATVATTPAAAPRAPARSAIGSRTVCHGTARVGQAQLGGQRGAQRDPGARPTRRGCRPRPPYCTGSEATTSASRSRAPSRPASQPAALSPNVVGSACCISVRPMTTSSRWAAASRAAASAAAARSASIAETAFAGQQHERGVQDVLAGGADVHGRGVPLPHRVLQHAHQRRHRVAGVGRLARRPSRGPAAPGRRTPRSPRRRPWSGTRPSPAAARASAASTSSRARNQASSETAAAAPPRAKVPSKSPLTRSRPGHRSHVAHTAKNTVSRSPCRWMSSR